MKFKKILLGLVLIGNFYIAQADVKWVDRIVAVVNEDVITERDLMDMYNNIKATAPKSTNDNEIKAQALAQLVDQKLVLQIAKLNEVKASPEEVQAYLAEIAHNNKTTIDGVYKQVAKEGVSKEWLNKTLVETIIVQKMTAAQMERSAHISDGEIDNFLQSQPPLTGPQFNIQHILLSAGKYSDNQAQSTIKEIQAQIKKGVAFTELASKYSDDQQTAQQGGGLGWVIPGLLGPEVDMVLPKLKVNEVSQPIKSQVGWQLIRLLEQRVQEVPQEQARILARNYITQNKQPALYQQWLQELRDSAYIKINGKPY